LFHRFPDAQIFIYKKLLISSRKCFHDVLTAATANVVCVPAIQKLDWWNKVSAPDLCQAHMAKFPWSKWQVETCQPGCTKDNNHELGNANSAKWKLLSL